MWGESERLTDNRCFFPPTPTYHMQHHQPSVASSVSSASDRSSIRHRSGQLSPFLSGPDEYKDHGSPSQASSLMKSNSQDWAFQFQEDLPINRHPTVLLVNSSRQSSRRYVSGPRLPSMPPSLIARTSLNFLKRVVSGSSISASKSVECPDAGLLSPVHLTPRPNSGSKFPPGLSDLSSESLISLPTPDFTVPSTHSILSILPRRLSSLTFGVSQMSSSPSPTAAVTAPEGRPQSLRSDSDYSTISADSAMTSSSAPSKNSIDSGRASLIPSINTTHKFTDKWPRPKSLRTHSFMDSDVSNSPNQTDAALLEEGQGPKMQNTEKWTVHKWCLLVSLLTVFSYGFVCLMCAVLTWLNGESCNSSARAITSYLGLPLLYLVWSQTSVVYTAANDVLILITLTGSILIFSSLIGAAGIILNSRPLLAAYAVLLWPGLMSMVTVGYLAYKRSTFALDHKLDSAWSEWYTSQGRLAIQDSLHCCGYYDALHEAIFNKRCYPRTLLPGCKGGLYQFEKRNLGTIWTVAFSLVPPQIANILIALLCANHVTRTFGEGITPARYRLKSADVKSDADKLSRTRGGEGTCSTYSLVSSDGPDAKEIVDRKEEQ